MGDERLETLLHAYVAERADDTQTVTSMFGLLTAAIGLITLIGFGLVNHDRVPSWLIALAPIIPLPFIAFAALLAQIAQIRGRVIDRYEAEIRAALRRTTGTRTLVPYGHTILDMVVWEAPFARTVVLVSFVSFFGAYVGVIFECFRYARGHEFALALTGLVGSSVGTSIFIGMYIAALFPHHWLNRGLERLRDRERDTW